MLLGVLSLIAEATASAGALYYAWLVTKTAGGRPITMRPLGEVLFRHRWVGAFVVILIAGIDAQSCSYNDIILRSHFSENLEDREGSVGVHTDASDWQKWTLERTDGDKFYLTSHRGEQLKDATDSYNVQMTSAKSTYEQWVLEDRSSYGDALGALHTRALQAHDATHPHTRAPYADDATCPHTPSCGTRFASLGRTAQDASQPGMPHRGGGQVPR